MYKLPKHIIVQKQQQVVQKAQALGHILVYSKYESNLAALPKLPKTKQEHFRFCSVREAVLFLQCPRHKNGRLQKTTIFNYLRARTGLLCCGREKVSQKLLNRTFSEETIKKMSLARMKPSTQGRDQDFRNRINRWRKEALEKSGNKCSILGNDSQQLHVHHLFVQRAFPSLRFDPENAIVLSREIHELFHSEYGHFRVVTIEHFIEFLSSLSQQGDLYRKIVKETKTANIRPISNQESTDSGSETTQILSNIEEIGSETTEILSNIEEIRQNMIQLKEVLFEKLSPIEQKIAIVSLSNRVPIRNFSNEKFEKNWGNV
jgi:hypothetical protein